MWETAPGGEGGGGREQGLWIREATALVLSYSLCLLAFPQSGAGSLTPCREAFAYKGVGWVVREEEM